VDHLQAEMLFKRVEVAVAMKERVATVEAEGGDQAIDRLPDRLALPTQRPVVPGRGRCFLCREILQHLAHDRVEDTQPLLGQLLIEPVGFRRVHAKLKKPGRWVAGRRWPPLSDRPEGRGMPRRPGGSRMPFSSRVS